MGNGRLEIKVEGKVYPLLFGMLAMELMAERSRVNPPKGDIKALTNVVYAGVNNARDVKDLSYLSNEEISEIVESILFSDEKDKAIEAIMNTLAESRAYVKTMEAGSKKK